MLTLLEFSHQSAEHQKAHLLALFEQVGEREGIFHDLQVSIDVPDVFSSLAYETIYQAVISIYTSLQDGQKEQAQAKLAGAQQYLMDLKAREAAHRAREEAEAEELLKSL